MADSRIKFSGIAGAFFRGRFTAVLAAAVFFTVAFFGATFDLAFVVVAVVMFPFGLSNYSIARPACHSERSSSDRRKDERSRRIFVRNGEDPSTSQNFAIAQFCYAQDDIADILILSIHKIP